MRRFAERPNPVVERLIQAGALVAVVLTVLFVLLLLEASGGHDGWLCEWGIDTDGAGTGDTGCG